MVCPLSLAFVTFCVESSPLIVLGVPCLSGFSLESEQSEPPGKVLTAPMPSMQGISTNCCLILIKGLREQGNLLSRC